MSDQQSYCKVTVMVEPLIVGEYGYVMVMNRAKVTLNEEIDDQPGVVVGKMLLFTHDIVNKVTMHIEATRPEQGVLFETRPL